MKRREFIRSSVALPNAALGVALGVTATATAAATEPAQVRRYRKLGKTGIEMGDISCGGGRLPMGVPRLGDPGALEAATRLAAAESRSK